MIEQRQSAGRSLVLGSAATSRLVDPSFTDPTTNRLAIVGAGPTCEVNETYYDAAGNLLCWQGNSFTYDPLGAVTRSLLSGNEYDHAYSAGGERLLTYQPGVGFRWTFRDLDGRLLREIKNVAGTWTVERDDIGRRRRPSAPSTWRDVSAETCWPS